MAKLLNGRELRDFIKERQAHQVRGLRQHFRVVPKLAIIETTNSPVSSLYTKLKKSYGQDINIEVDIYSISMDQVDSTLSKLNIDDSVKGIIIQLPLAEPDKTDELLNKINPKKDVDGLGDKAKWQAATPTAINWLLAGYNVDLRNKNIVIVGQGRLVGAPLAKMWRDSGLAVSTLDISSGDLKPSLLKADIIVTATGVAGLIKSDMIKLGATVVDAGVSSEAGEMRGDLDLVVYDRDDLSLTPIKGGVGPLTVAALFDNVIQASYPE